VDRKVAENARDEANKALKKLLVRERCVTDWRRRRRVRGGADGSGSAGRGTWSLRTRCRPTGRCQPATSVVEAVVAPALRTGGRRTRVRRPA
jgi:hypothetical protein